MNEDTWSQPWFTVVDTSWRYTNKSPAWVSHQHHESAMTEGWLSDESRSGQARYHVQTLTVRKRGGGCWGRTETSSVHLCCFLHQSHDAASLEGCSVVFSPGNSDASPHWDAGTFQTVDPTQQLKVRPHTRRQRSQTLRNEGFRWGDAPLSCYSSGEFGPPVLVKSLCYWRKLKINPTDIYLTQTWAP